MALPYISEELTTILLVLLVVLFLLWMSLLTFRLSRLSKGKNGRSLEALIHQIQKTSTVHENELSLIKNTLKDLSKKSTEAIRGVGMVRFNALRDTGGNQSFAIALLSEAGNGVAISTITGPERSRIFIKKLTNFSSDVELTPEEKEAIRQAQSNVV